MGMKERQDRLDGVYWQLYGCAGPRVAITTRDDWETAMRGLDPSAQVTEGPGPGEVTVFAEPNSFRDVARVAWERATLGVRVRLLPRPEFLPDAEHGRKTKPF